MIPDPNSRTHSHFPPNPHRKDGYRLTFCDDFDQPELAADKWFPYYLPQWSSRDDAKARYTFQDNQLLLHIEENQRPWSEEFDGALRVSSLQTGCFSGPVGSNRGQHPFRDDLVVREEQPALRLYTPTYGYFETRLRAVPVPGYLCALWMIGFEEEPEQSAEICICEIKGEHIGHDASQIGYGVHPFNDSGIGDEFFEEIFDIDASNFHVYAVDWTRDGLDFYIDNVKTRTIHQSPNYAMQFMLDIYELRSEACDAPFPRTMTVDYVRGYERKRHG